MMTKYDVYGAPCSIVFVVLILFFILIHLFLLKKHTKITLTYQGLDPKNFFENE